MTDLSNHFCLIRPEDISGILKLHDIVRKPHSAREFTAISKVSFDQTHTSNASGGFWTQNFRAVVCDMSALEYNCLRCLVGVFRDDGSMFVIGSSTEAPEISVTPYRRALLVEAQFSSPEPAVI